MATKPAGPTIKVKGKAYDVNKDFTWRELITVEELGGVPLGTDGALDSMAVGGAFVFVILKREQPDLTWDAFLDEAISDVAEEKPARSRPTKPAAKPTA